jgi:iron complex transport system ATP-binding protein
VRLAVEELGVTYGGIPGVSGIRLEAEPGTVTAVVGPNGAGKSTLLRAVAGQIPTTGRIAFDGVEVPARARRLRAGEVGFLPQDLSARPALTVFEVVLLGRLGTLGLRVGPTDLEAAQTALTDLGIVQLAHRYVGELSGGQRQLVYLAQVLVRGPRLLLLDEPTSALDLRNQLEILQLVRRETHGRGLTTLLAIHDLNAAARFADQVLHDGRRWSAGAPALTLTPDMLAEVYGVEAEVRTGPDGFPTVTVMRAASRHDDRIALEGPRIALEGSR